MRRDCGLRFGGPAWLRFWFGISGQQAHKPRWTAGAVPLLKPQQAEFPPGLDTAFQRLTLLKSIAARQKTVEELLNRLEELQGIVRETPGSGEAVTLSTIHSSKGLEYDRVLLVDLIDGQFPSKLAAQRGRFSRLRSRAPFEGFKHIRALWMGTGDKIQHRAVKVGAGLVVDLREAVEVGGVHQPPDPAEHRPDRQADDRRGGIRRPGAGGAGQVLL